MKDTFPLQGASGAGVRAEVSGGRLRVTVESEQPWPDGASATARMAGPDLVGSPLALERTSPTTFVGEAPASAPGTYAVGVEVTGSRPLLSGTAIANHSYSPEYRPGAPEPEALERLSRLGGGRGAIRAAAAFDPTGLPPGRASVALTGWLLLAAALLWPVDVALRRLALHGAATKAASRVAGRAALAVGRRLPRLRRMGGTPGRRGPVRRRPEAPVADRRALRRRRKAGRPPLPPPSGGCWSASSRRPIAGIDPLSERRPWPAKQVRRRHSDAAPPTQSVRRFTFVPPARAATDVKLFEWPHWHGWERSFVPRLSAATSAPGRTTDDATDG